MDYIGNKCPVCKKYFHADDDIVVCPECGTPHHRECYEQTGHCCNEHLHAQGFDYQSEHEGDKESQKICPSCGKENDKDSFFCKYCGASLSSEQTKDRSQQTNPNGFSEGSSQAGNPFFVNMMDPLGGVPGDTDFGDGVTAGEAAKYVKQNTPYFMRVFSNIKNFNKSRFNFCAAIFTGGYMLYRKMYKLGALFASLNLALLIVETYIRLVYNSLFTEFETIQYNSLSSANPLSSLMQFMSDKSITDILVLYLPTLISFIRVAMMIVIGICFNRMYFKHCKKQIVEIKKNASGDENSETLLQTKGGVNIALAISLMIAYAVIIYLPSIIVNFF